MTFHTDDEVSDNVDDPGIPICQSMKVKWFFAGLDDSEIEVLAIAGDGVSANETGLAGGGDNLQDSRIYVVLDDSTTIDLSNKNRLTNIVQGGGGTDGGNMTLTYSYRTFNDLTITQDNDPG